MHRQYPRLAGVALALSLFTLVPSQSAQAIVVNDTTSGAANPTANTVAPTSLTLNHGDPGWSNVGAMDNPGQGSGVYIGNGWVLTARHVAKEDTLNHHIVLNGTTYYQDNTTPIVRLQNPNSGVNGGADLTLVKLATNPGLAPLTISTTSPVLTQQVVLMGAGYVRGSAQKNYPGGYVGYDWSASTAKNWATNSVSSAATTFYTAVNGVKTEVFDTTFNQNVVGDGQATLGDSGGAAFSYVAGQWELTGIMITITEFTGGINQPTNTAVYGNQTLIADLAVYSSQINSFIPEPASIALLAFGSLGLIRRRRPA